MAPSVGVEVAVGAALGEIAIGVAGVLFPSATAYVINASARAE